MPAVAPSALITDNGRRILLRIRGRCFELTPDELRSVLGLPEGPPGLAITIGAIITLFVVMQLTARIDWRRPRGDGAAE